MNRRNIIKTLMLVLGGSLSIPTLGAMAEQVHKHHSQSTVTDTAYQFRIFDEQQLALLNAFTDVIIPRSDTVGARDVAVPAFMDMMLADWYDEEDTAIYMVGLAGFSAYIQKIYDTDFINLTAEERHAEVAALDLQVMGRREDNPFYAMTKKLTLIGYYTSEEAMDKELHYQGLIGEFDFEPSGPPGSVTRY